MKKSPVLLAFILFVAGTNASASSITSFSFTADPSPFFSNLTSSFTSTTGSVTGTVACDSDSACTGEVGTFSLGLDLVSMSAPFSVEVSGTLSEGSAADAALMFTSPGSVTYPFVIPVGDFDTVVLSTSAPALGAVTVDGAFDLSLAPGQTLSLPLNFNLGPVPEPSGQTLVGLGLLGIVCLTRFSRIRSNRAE
jgi:hypothetical protein